MQYLINQSRLGNHILFDNETIIRVAKKAGLKQSDDKLQQKKVEALLERMIECPSLITKQQFLAKLDTETYDELVSLYLNIVQNTSQDSQGYLQ